MRFRRDRRVRALRFENLESRLAFSTFAVAPTGSDSNPGTAAAPWRTLQKAADTVQPGDTVDVLAGNYAGMDLWTSGTADQRIVFHAEPGAVVNARNQRTADGINLEGASYVTIEGFTVTGVPRAGIRAVLDDHVIVRNNVTDQNGVWGIFTGWSEDLLVENNVASRSVQQHGIYVSNSADRPTIRGNTVFGNNDSGIQINADLSQGGDGIITGALIENNIVHDNGFGGGAAINLDGVQDSIVQNNLLYNNHASGVALFQQNGATGSQNNLVVNNTIVQATSSRYAVLLFGGSTGNTIVNNVLYNNSATSGSIDVSSDSLSGMVSDYNVLMDRVLVDGAFPLKTLAGWQSASGFDLHSVVATPVQLFVDPSADDYHLAATSPANDRGTTLRAPGRDLSGNVRPTGSGIDIGAYERVVASTGSPRALYHLDETSGTTATDASGNGRSAIYNGGPALGQSGALASGTAVSFNGTNQYASLPAGDFGTYGTPMSFETWFNAPAGASGVILGQTSSGATPGGAAPSGFVPVLALGTDGKLRSSALWHGDTSARIASAAALDDGRWHHVALTFANGVENLYIDGQLAGAQTAGAASYAAAYTYFLGTGYTAGWAAGNSGWHFFRGALDEVVTYDRPLSAGEVAQHYAAGNVTPPPTGTGATALYHFDETTGTVAADSSGNQLNAAYVNNPAIGQTGALGSGTAISLNGANQYVSLPANAMGTYGAPVSFETWFNAPAGSSGVILSQTAAGATPGAAMPAGYVPVLAVGTDGRLRSSMFWHGDTSARIASSGTVNDGRWHHAAVTYANGIESLYIDGQIAGTQLANEIPYATAYNYFLGTGYTGGWTAGNGGWHFFRGALDEAATYGRALSATEIAQHYAAGSATNPQQPAADATALYHFDDASTTVATDSSGNQRNATYNNSPLVGQPGALAAGTAITLNGTNQSMTLPADAMGQYGSPITFETWFNAAAGSSGVILGQAAGTATPGGGMPAGYVPALAIGTDGKLRSSLFWHGDVNSRIATAGTYNDGRWHHVAVTYANGIESLYVDGQLAGQQTAPEVTYALAYSYFLGAGYTGGWTGGNGGWQFFRGSFDETAIYARALSAAEIAQHYAAGAK